MKSKKSEQTTIAQLVEASSVNAVSTPPINENKLNESLSEKLTNSSASDNRPLDVNNETVNIMDRLVASHMLVPGSNLDPMVVDDYRRIKRPLVSNACGRDKALVERGNLILVTSSIPGEGKSYTSVNLALSLSQEMDNTVLLVDCDVAKQGVSRMLGLENIAGLVDVLESDTLHIGDVLLHTDVPNLRVVSAGKKNEYMTELLASQRMSNLVNEIINRYSNRIIIFDGPPLLATPQTRVLAELVGQVVFVVESGKTPQTLVEDAIKLIPEGQAIGLVMNKNIGQNKRGYYYGHYGSEDHETKADS
ncbi:MAG: AAA family ATPase [Gammaproteobacteria bacterium]|nr:AAA family ATPase [Gammaproteobacteria bacterium]